MQTTVQPQLSFTLPSDFNTFIEALVAQKVEEAMSLVTSPQQQPEWLSITAAAKYVHVVYNTIRKYINSGEIPVSVFGGCQRIRRSDLDAFLNARSL